MLYDFKNEEEIQDVVVDNEYEIIDDILQKYNMLRYGEYIAVYAPYDIIYSIVNSFVENEDLNFYLYEDSDAIGENPSNGDGLLIIECDGGIMIEPSRGKNGKLKYSMSTFCYFYDGYMEEEKRYLSFTEERILVFGFKYELKHEDKESEENLDTDIFKGDDGLHGFEFSKMTENGSYYYSFYTTENLSNDFYKEIANILK